MVSAATLVFELGLTRLFAVAQFYHFAFMAISLALLGSGAAGSILSVARRRIRPAPLALSFGIAITGAYLALNHVPFDSYAIAWDSTQVVYLILYFFGAAVPFTLGGLIVAQALESEPEHAHKVYAASLVGSAFGCVGVLAVLDRFGGEGTVLVATLLAFGAAVAFGKKRLLWSLSLIPALAALLAPQMPDFMELRLSPYKSLVAALRAPGAEHVYSAWNSISRVDVVESPAIHSMPGLSLNAPVVMPPQVGVTLDGDNLMPVTGLSPDDPDAAALADHLITALAYRLRPGAHTLILGPGGGLPVLMALAAGAGHVTVVEDNALLIDVVRTRYSEFTDGLYDDPRVTLVYEDGRAYVRRTDEVFDLIELPLTDGFRPVTSGAYSLAEDYRYTVDAFGDYLSRLEPDGLLLVTRWLQTPPSESARTLGIIIEALRGAGVADPEEHIIAYRAMLTATFIVGKSPFTADELTVTREFLSSRGFDPVLLPGGLEPDEINRFNVLPEPAYHDLFSRIVSDPAATWAGYEFDIRPPTDDHPFFFHYFRWRQTPQVLASLGRMWQPFGGSGYFVLVILLGLALVASALLILAPLALRRRRARLRIPGGVRWAALVYFALIGLGFLLIEMPLAQHFILFLGHPIVALSVVIFSLLTFSGLGSLTAPKWSPALALGLLSGAAIVYPPLLATLFEIGLRLPMWARLIVAVLSLAPLGVLMGVPFARGLALVESLAPGLTPWVWAVNGCASVLSAILAVMLALSWGFTATLWVGAACYLGALGASLALGIRVTPLSPRA